MARSGLVAVSSFTAALAQGPIVLDGGLGTRLEARGNDVTSALWSAEVLRSTPEEVRATHLDFFHAGARVATTASYQVSYDGYARVGIGADVVDALLKHSVEAARDARETAGLTSENAWVLASIGPFGASLGDGSEYTGAYALGEAELQQWHLRRMHVLAASGPDALLCETIPSIAEARALAGAMHQTHDLTPSQSTHSPVILSFTVADGILRSGESLAEAAHVAAETPGIVAIGVNCSSATDATTALRAFREVTELPFIVYPNSGEVWNARARSWDGDVHPLVSYVDEWIGLGARLIGGCCRVDTPELHQIAGAVARNRA